MAILRTVWQQQTASGALDWDVEGAASNGFDSSSRVHRQPGCHIRETQMMSAGM